MKNFTGIVKRLADTGRYSQVQLYKRESVLEHSGMVCLLSLAIGSRINKEHTVGPPIEMETLLTKAIIHDVEEAIVGDIPAPTKLNEHLTYAIKKMEHRAAREIFRSSAVPELLDLWDTAKQGNDGMIVSFVDNFVCLLKFHDEIVMRGNRNMAQLIRPNFSLSLCEKLNAMLEVWGDNSVCRELYAIIEKLELEIQNVR